MVIHSKKTFNKIDQLFAFVGVDDDGDEGILASMMFIDGRSVMMPLVGADEARVASMKEAADQIAKNEGITYKILKFTNKEDVTQDF